ncbi:TPA: DUF4352 domain-containing protein [Clostridium perfringens]|uniref:DUF4352 domain-containing protein n=1 Tax=Clostridium perfringens TaxID=1502 RepID=UPI002FCCFD1C
MNKEKLKSLFTSKIAIGIISFIIGGIALGNSSSGVNLTKERYNQLLEFEKVALQKEGDSLETLNEENLDNKINEKTEEDKRPLSIGETAYINDENGVKSMAITIDNVKLTDERNQFSEKEAEKVVVIEYTYENIADEENLYVFDSNFKVYDASGNVLETYPAGAEKHPQSISKGKKCTANMSFALNNESNNLELEFYDNMFNGKASEVFNISGE